MPSFAKWLTPDDVKRIRAYVVSCAQDATEAAGEQGARTGESSGGP